MILGLVNLAKLTGSRLMQGLENMVAACAAAEANRDAE